MTIEVDGMLWKPLPGATASAAEFIHARSLVMEILELGRWNPWVMEDRTAEYEAALALFGQWTRAESGFRRKTREELQAEDEQWLADLDASTKAENARRNQERAARASSYDSGRAQARLELLEQQAALAGAVQQRDGIAARGLFPAMPEDARQLRLSELDRAITEATAIVEELTHRVGESDAVADEHGWLPSERRELALQVFVAHRVSEVRELRQRVAAHQAELKAAKDRAERARIRDALHKTTRRLGFLEAVPPMTAADMCSECVTPASWHGFVFEISDANPDRGPCPVWPHWQQRLRNARQIMAMAAKPASRPPPPKPQPLAVIPSGLPIEEVISRLAAAQTEHPGATVRRGNRNRWEIWPP
jgi:hypothetical protein